MQIRRLLQDRGMAVHAVSSDLTVQDAIRWMAEKKTSALIVTQADKPLGIFTERDVMRCHLDHSEGAISQLSIQQVMTNKLIVAEPHDEIHRMISLMLQTDIRHLPVEEEGRIIGILHIRDLVQHCIASLTAELEHLQQYIADLQDAARD